MRERRKRRSEQYTGHGSICFQQSRPQVWELQDLPELSELCKHGAPAVFPPPRLVVDHPRVVAPELVQRLLGMKNTHRP